jgi:NAD(P)H dehydrogenase (quinone)
LKRTVTIHPINRSVIFNLPVAETLSDDVLQKMHAPPKPAIPVIKVDELTEPDGIIFGIPTRFGTMPAQIKA